MDKERYWNECAIVLAEALAAEKGRSSSVLLNRARNVAGQRMRLFAQGKTKEAVNIKLYGI